MFTKFRKTKAFAFIVGFALAASAGALAAFLLYQGLSGGANGQFSNNSSTQTALVVANDGAAPALDPGGQAQVPLKVTNMDAGGAHALTSTATVTITTVPSQCASYLSKAGFLSGGSVSHLLDSGTSYAPGETKQAFMLINVDQNTPGACVGADWSATFSAPTN